MRIFVLLCALHFSLFAQPPAVSPDSKPVITITKDGGLFINQNPVSVSALVGTIRGQGSTSAVYIRADKETTWQAIAPVLSELDAAKPTIPMKFIFAKVDR